MKKTVCLLAAAVGILLTAGDAFADLLGVNIGFPKVVANNNSATAITYNPASQALAISSPPLSIQFSPAEGSRIISGTKGFQITAQVDQTGALVPGAGNTFTLSGSFTRTVNGTTTAYSGVLLSGTISAFGYFNAGGGVGLYDLRGTASAGELLPFFTCGDFSVNITSGNSTFTGGFTTSFEGEAKCQAGLEDVTPPVIVCPTNIVVESQSFAGGLPGAYVSYPMPLVTDNCDTNPSVTFMPPSGSFFELPAMRPETNYTVVVIAEDASGNTNSCTFTVTVEDTLPPQFADTNNPVIEANLTNGITLTNGADMCEATYSFPNPFAVDNSATNELPTTVSAIDQNGATIPLTTLPGGYLQGQFPVGSNVVTITASDGHGNTAVHQTAIIVVDTEPPMIMCPTNQIYPYTVGPVEYVEPVASDNCPGVTLTLSPTNGSALPVGTNVISAVAVDASGNTASCQFTVTVNPASPPTITCPPDVQLACGGPSDPSITGKATATANCGSSVAITYSDAATPPGCAGEEGVDRTWTASDGCGQSATCVQHITFIDTNAPTLTVPSGTNLGCNPGSLPTCGGVKGMVTASGNCSSVVTVTVTSAGATTNGCAASQVFNVYATDACSNTATATVTYTWTANRTAPILQVPTGGSLGCNPRALPTIASVKAQVTATGNCGSATTVTVTSAGPTTNGCAGSQVFNVSALNGCNNSATATVTYTWTANTTSPVIAGAPMGSNLGCNPTSIPSDAYIQSLVNAIGSCGATTTIAVTNVDSTNGCAAQREFIITATDSCGNAAMTYVTYSWTIDHGPTIVCPPTYTLNTNCQFVYCTFAPGDWNGPCNNGYYGWGNYGNSWWNSWCQQNNNNDCTSSFNNWWLKWNGVNGGGTTWWKAWNSQNCGAGWWSGWSSSYSGNWWSCWNKNNYGTQCFVPCSGNNPGSILCNNFNRLYPNGCVVGSQNGYTVTCDSWQAVQQCLGFSGSPGPLNGNATDPSSSSARSFCAQVLCLKLNCDFGDDGCSSGGNFFGPFGDCVLNNPSLPCNGKRVRDICAVAQNCLGGGALPPSCTISQLCNLVACLNQCFQGCKVSGWCSSNLCPVINPTPSLTGYPSISGGCSAITSTNYVDVTTPMNCPGGYVITRTWTVSDSCGVSNTCQQTINVSQSPDSTIVGKVVLACNGDPDLNNNAGFSNVLVTLKQGSSTIASDVTDVDGNYAFVDVPAGTYTVAVTPSSGYSETSPTDGRNSQTITVGDCQSGTVPAFGYIGNHPALTLAKCGLFCATNGQTIPYTFTIVNTGDACLNITLNDPMLGGVIFSTNSVPPGTIITFTNTYLITNRNVCAITNTATATGTSGSSSATSTSTAVTLLMTQPRPSSVCGSFNNSNPGGGSVWFNAHLCSPPTQACTVSCQGATVTFTCSNGHVYTYPVPDCKITFSPSCSTPSSYFDGTCWNTTMPCNGDSEAQLSCFGIPWNNDFRGCQNVCWSGNFSCDCANYTCNWQWGAACYSRNLLDCGNVNVKPCHDTPCPGFNSGEHSCTPENFKNYCVSGGTGSGGGNYCGSWSSTGSVTCH